MKSHVELETPFARYYFIFHKTRMRQFEVLSDTQHPRSEWDQSRSVKKQYHESRDTQRAVDEGSGIFPEECLF